jgi:UDP-glucose 4-epimerase
MKKVLVTGGAGFIASHIVDALVTRGYDVVVVDDLSRGNAVYINPGAKFYKLDICSPNLSEIFSKEKPEIVNHHAARTSVTHSLSEPADDAEVNILGSLNLLQNCVKWQVKKIIYASSGGAIYGEPVYLPCDETHPIAPLSPYGVSKYAAELYLHSYQNNFGLQYVILRYANVYGPRQIATGEAGVVAKFSSQMLRGLDIVINGNGEQERDFVHVTDIVRANMLAMEQTGSQIYNLGTGEGVSIKHLFHQLKSLTGYRREPHYVPDNKGEIFKTFLTAAKAKRELGWAPETSLEDGLKNTLDFYKDGDIMFKV